jgi:peroxiredoxin/predicted 2-oxoglutarate/Fe(II)-dependent dioxygenase YbiX
MRSVPLSPGEPAPWFKAPTASRGRFTFDVAAGRVVVLSFLGSSAEPRSAALLEAIRAARTRFNDADRCFFGVCTDPADEREARVADDEPGIRFFWDFDREISASYGAVRADGEHRPLTYVLDAALRVVAVFEPDDTGDHVTALFDLLERLPPAMPAFRAPEHAPVLVLPRIFEPALCEALCRHYDANGGEDSGFMRDVNGVTTKIIEHGHKRRRDCTIGDEALRRACMVRIHDRLVPEIRKAFQFQATRMERYIVACYDAAEAGHFRPHRDNTTRGTAHRRFAVSLFLNTGEYDGGLLRFPEFGSAVYSAPRGGAVVFSCSLLHEATAVTSGRRYMFLPFLYDDAGRRVREDNLRFLDPAVGGAAGSDPP